MLKSEELISKLKLIISLNPDTLNKAYDFALKALKLKKRRRCSTYNSSCCSCKYINRS